MSAKSKFISKYGYPLMVTVYFTTVLIIFVFAARFLSHAFNSAFDSGSLLAPALVLDRASATFVSTRLGVSEHPVVPETPTPAPTDTSVIAPVAPVGVDKAALTIRVLNATSTTGLAGIVKAQLQAAGYANVSTGNASAKTSLTQIQTKATATAAVTELTSLLGSTYSLDTTTSLPDGSGFDVVIIVGSGRK